MRVLAGLGCVIAGMAGLYLHVEYSGWVLLVGLLILI